MKRIVIYILENGNGEKFKVPIAIGKDQDPNIVIKSLLLLKNRNKLQGESPLSLVRIRLKTNEVSFAHDWIKVGENYMCRDCKVVGEKKNPLLNVHPIIKDKKYIDCKWKLKK